MLATIFHKVSFNDSLVENPPKKRKFDSNENTVSQWLFMNVANIALTIEDKADIDNGRWLQTLILLSIFLSLLFQV